MTATTGGRANIDVLVVGAGPTGLLLAGDLATAGLSVTLVERRPHEISNLSRALVVHARTLEQLDARGLADGLVAGGHPIDRLQLFQALTLNPSRLPGRFPFILFTPQYEVERVLEQRAQKAGVTFVHNTQVTGLEQDATGVTVHTGTGDDYRASYVVGTDGAHSGVRKALGLPFPGKTLLSSMILADVRLGRKPDRPFTVYAGSTGFCLVTEMGDGWYRITGWSSRNQVPDDTPLGLDEVQDLLRENFGTDYDITECRWKSRFHSDERQAPKYRVGRAFLAGDAAHVHTPAGGMGMNTGLQDAANLSWKLVAVLRDGADERILDTYEAERHRVGVLVLRMSGTLVRVGVLRTGPARLARTVLATLLTHVRPLTDKAASMISGIGIAYPAGRGAHRLAGRRAPDDELAEGRLYELLREGRFVLIGAGEPPVSPPGEVVSAHWADDRRTTVLVRPDGYIAWASDKPDAEGLRRALADWTGARQAA